MVVTLVSQSNACSNMKCEKVNYRKQKYLLLVFTAIKENLP